MSENLPAELPRRAGDLMPSTRLLLDILESYENHLEGYHHAKTISKTVERDHRSALQSRYNQLRQRLECHERDRQSITNAVLYLIGLFTAGRKTDKTDAMRIASAYVLALEGLPSYFVERSCFAFCQGLVDGHDPAYTPTSAEIGKLARSMIQPFRAEADRINQVLKARFIAAPSPDVQKRVGDKYLEFAKELHEKADKDRRELLERVGGRMRASSEAAIKRMWAARRKPIRESKGYLISPSLVANIVERATGSDD